MAYEHIVHGFEPVYDNKSRLLILGSLPSVKSRENNFYYGHPQNRFWKVIAAITDEDVPQSVNEKKDLLLRNNIAVWDVIAECDIEGSSDQSIKNVVPTDLSVILKSAPVTAIYTNGGAATRIYSRYQLSLTGIEAVQLPSTSPANAAWTLERLINEWKEKIR